MAGPTSLETVMDIQMKRELIETIRIRTDILEKAFAENDLNKVKAMEALLGANMEFLSNLIDRMEGTR